MKTTHFQLLHRIVQFAAVISAICFTGCANIDDILEDIEVPPEVDNGTIIANMPIAEIEVLLAESDPVQVTVEVNGWLPDSCTAHHETHQTQEGNTDHNPNHNYTPERFCLRDGRNRVPRERVSIGTLPAGNYIVIVNDVEQQFRVD